MTNRNAGFCHWLSWIPCTSTTKSPNIGLQNLVINIPVNVNIEIIQERPIIPLTELTLYESWSFQRLLTASSIPSREFSL